MLSSNVAMQSLVSSMSNLNDKETRISSQIASGLRISSLSDDAVGAGQAVTLAGTLRTDDAFTATASSVGNRMQAADAALSSVVTQMTSAISTATAGLNGTTSSANQVAAAQALLSVRDTLLSLANSSYGGSYLFGGASTAVPFSMDSSGTVSYSGSSSVPFCDHAQWQLHRHIACRVQRVYCIRCRCILCPERRHCCIAVRHNN